MSLRGQKFLPFYNSKSNDLIEEFYVPALSNCDEYKRVSAFFDSNILRLYSAALENIILSKGHVSFIFSSQVSEEDFEKMKNGYENRADIEKGLLDKIDFSNDFEISNLAYLIAYGYVDIKIAFTKKGILHDKFGLISQGNDTLYFRGSNNETIAAIQNNYESFETSSTWTCDSNELTKIQNAINEFDKLWNNKCDDTLVVDIPNVLKEKIIKHNKDRLILNYTEKPNTFIFDLDDKSALMGINNLNNPTPLLPGSMWYMGYLSYYVKNKPTASDKVYLFDPALSYIGMRKIIGIISNKAEERGFDVYISPRLRRYFLDNDIQAEKRRSLGIGIKQHADVVLSVFEEFKQIVNGSMDRQLREPQMWDAFHIAKMKRSANFSVPGSGKTSIVYGAFSYLYKTRQVDKIVMIGPINSFLAWKKEFSLNFGNKLEPIIYDYHEHSYKSEQERFDGLRLDSKNCNLILINYESVQMNIDALKSIIDDRTLLVFDEVHRIKSTTGKRAMSCFDISKKAIYKVVLTGTPIPNGFLDIYNFLHILFPDEYDIVFDFDKSFLVSANNSDEKKVLINNALYPFFCRTTKKDLMVPPPEDDDIETGYCLFDDKYEKLLELIYRECDYSTLLLYIRLMQVSTNPSLILNKLSEDDFGCFADESGNNDPLNLLNIFSSDIDKEEYSEEEKNFIRSFDMTPKFYKGIELAQSLVKQGNQVIIWEVFVDTISRTREELKKKGIRSEVIFGATSIPEREAIIERFINKQFDVLITNPHTLAESVSLHKNCHHAIYMEYSFNLVHMLQSRDRIHRLGLSDDEKTYYYYMMMDNPSFEFNTIDKKIYERLKVKEDIQNGAVEGDELIYIEDDFKKDIEELLSI